MNMQAKGDTFRIMQVTDVHLRDFDGEKDVKSLELIKDLIGMARPDLVVSTGDLVSSPNSAYTLEKFAAFMAEQNQPWTFCFGNHDAEYGAPARELESILSAAPGCIYEHGEESVNGSGNFVITVSDGEGEAKWALYMIDSGDSSTNPRVKGYDWIRPCQIEWYRKERAALPGVPSLFFFHIPLPEYDEVWLKHECRGSKFEKVCAPRINTGFFAAMLEDTSAKATFVGHDHTNDYCGELCGVNLCYGRGTGYSGYGSDTFLRGVRVIDVTLSTGEYDTFCLLSDRSVTRGEPHQPEQV